MTNLKANLLLLCTLLSVSLIAQDFDGPRPSGSSSDGINIANFYNTNIQLTARTWSASHGILFNAYKPTSLVSGSLATTGNTKYAHGAGQYSGGAGAIMFFGNGGGMGFYISPVSTGADDNVLWGTPKMYLRRSGEVGIGTTDTDGYKLSVAGNVRAEEVKVEAAPWPDYVFDEGYDLKSLEETEEYIRENKHLPNMPSAAEVEENGVSLGEMNAKLLEKIEELTLHQIELQKQLKEQQKLIIKLLNDREK